MTDQNEEIPNQRGTSSGEIGQNPVEIIGKDHALPESKAVSESEAKEDSAGSKGQP